MASLKTKVKLYLESHSKDWENEKRNLLLQNDSNNQGDYIKSWNVNGVAKPTVEQLATYESSGDTEEANNVVIGNRKKEYGLPEKQIENIIENGLESEQTRVQTIKDKYPKS